MALYGSMLPSVTHLQYLVLDVIRGREWSGREIRKSLKEHGISKSLPAFYQLMSRLEDSGFVEGRYVQRDEDGVMLTERFYRVTAEGSAAFAETYNFYAAAGLPFTPLPA